MSVAFRRSIALLAGVIIAGVAAATGTGCGLFDGDDSSPKVTPGGDDGGTPDADPQGDGGKVVVPPTPEPPKPPSVAVYNRGSLPPVYRLLPRSEYGRLRIADVTFQDSDYTTTAVTTSARAKLDELAIQIGAERGATPPILIPDAADRDRADKIPFRGNPSDVKVVTTGGKKKLYVPLGGDVMTPGNEIAVVTADAAGTFGAASRIKVGLRPQRIAVHPAGLVFVCNQYSNYISIIDPVTDAPLMKDNKPVEIKSEYFCADLIITPKDPRSTDDDHQVLWVANRWRHSVLKYQADVVRDNVTKRIIDVIQTSEKDPVPASKPAAELFGVGANPWRLALADTKNAIYVANDKGGELSRIELANDSVKRVTLGAPTVDVTSIKDLVFVATTTRDRGLLSRTDTTPPQVASPPVTMKGLDGQDHVANPGALFDDTKSYNFEDVRNGMFQLDAQLVDAKPLYYTDDVSSEANYASGQKVLAGAIPQAVAKNAAGDRIFVAMSGSNVVQELQVDTATRPYVVKPTGRTFATKHRPFSLALDQDTKRLFVADWGSEIVESFDLVTGARIAEVDLGYAVPAYPATNMEKGERFFYDASWSNNGRKSCATCHIDELDTDGVGYSNGAQAPTAYHQVKPNHDLPTTDAYFWNGSFSNGSYASLAFAAQTRTNCELIELAMIDGPASDPATRNGDTNNRFRIAAEDPKCRPQLGGPGQLTNEAAILTTIAAEKKVADAQIIAATGLDRTTLSRLIDWYSVSEGRLPPNPLKRLTDAGELADTEKDNVAKGKALFTTAGCNNCHKPDDARHPFCDGADHGPGATWAARFVAQYKDDTRLRALLPNGIPQTMLDPIKEATADRTINLHLNIDAFTPFCFTVDNCLEFLDPLASRGNRDEETRRLELLIKVNLANNDRGFLPGNLPGQAHVNTPSLRGVWTQANLLHHGLAHTVSEAILAPGHPALAPGEIGYAVDATGIDVHGATSKLTKEDVLALTRYVESIE